MIVKFVFVSELVANELLGTAHGQVALKAVQRFLSHNPEWVGQTIGAGLAPETEAGGPGVGAEHRIIPWGYSVYRQTNSHDMINNIGGVNIASVMSYSIDWEAAYR